MRRRPFQKLEGEYFEEVRRMARVFGEEGTGKMAWVEVG